MSVSGCFGNNTGAAHVALDCAVLNCGIVLHVFDYFTPGRTVLQFTSQQAERKPAGWASLAIGYSSVTPDFPTRFFILNSTECFVLGVLSSPDRVVMDLYCTISSSSSFKFSRQPLHRTVLLFTVRSTEFVGATRSNNIHRDTAVPAQKSQAFPSGLSTRSFHAKT